MGRLLSNGTQDLSQDGTNGVRGARRLRRAAGAAAALLVLAAGVLPGAARADGVNANVTQEKLQINWTFPDPSTGRPVTLNTGALNDRLSGTMTQAEQAVMGP